MAKPDNRSTSYVYPPSIWDHEFVQSLKSDYTKESEYGRRAAELKEWVRRMFADHQKETDRSLASSDLLMTINIIQRLGISYHFDDEIKVALYAIKDENNVWEKKSLVNQAVRFRLLRQHGYEVSQELRRSTRSSPMKASMRNSKYIEEILSVYEASFYAYTGEKVLKEVQEFKEVAVNNNKNIIIRKMVSHALGIPLHWEMQRIQTRWFIDVYEMMEDMNPLLLEFAKLDFNMVQAIYQEDLKYISRWWQELDYLQILKFSRDRWVEAFFWIVGSNYEPNMSGFRRHITNLVCVLCTIDDMHDIYGSPDDLKRFGDAIDRWDVNTLEDLPYFMKVCFMAVFNLLNGIAYDILKKHGFYAISYLKKSMAVFCKSYMAEESWYEYTPTLEEYLDNGWISAAGSILPTVSFFNIVKEPTKEALECIINFNLSDIRRYAFEIVRLTNDLGTSSDELKRGATPTSIQCYMHDSGVSELAAREHIKHVINDKWEMMNNDKSSRSIYPESFIDTMQNFARAAHALYQFGEGYGDGYSVASENLTKGRIVSLFFEPIPVLLV
ncbi:hypothetical protein MKX03_023974 [Papaver bracteatum]|nr:hypothetical protein MKX03_023974 [Papaver bracteatum]